MRKKSILQKIWTASPQTFYIKMRGFFKSSGVLSRPRVKAVEVKGGFANGVKLIMPLEIPGPYESMVDGTYEDFIIKALQKHIPLEGKTIWDVGAHVGYQSFSFANIVGKTGKIIAFEPNPHNINTFRKNLEINPVLSRRIMLKTDALSDKNGVISFNIGRDKNDATTSGGHLSTVTPPLPDFSYADFSPVSVNTITIDTLISKEKIPIPDIIKIDVEGAELSVLQGGSDFLKTHKPIFIIEIHTIPMMFHVEHFLRTRGYAIELIDESGDILTKNICAVPTRK